MASYPYTSFTITQPFLGAPLQFSPPRGSEEFELLIDCYVTGSASKQDKLSQVTIDFYNNATVDLNTGALTKTYDVFPIWASQPFEQSPVQSQSSGFSPHIYTPSPGSSMTLGDSSYSSLSMTPPSRPAHAGGRVAKKTKKDTKKPAEARLPGFSIMTKDGVDVTTSAGRGTKTKEQREHAHLMRQLKACADCKRKKIRCDPSHRRSHNDMSRTSTSNTSSSSGKYPSPLASTPSILGNMSSLDTPNAFDDFILFPDDMASWNPVDLGMDDFATQDLSQFNFDINELDTNAFAPLTPDQELGFASHRQQSYSNPRQPSFQQPLYSPSPSSFLLDSHISGCAPLLSDQYGVDSWAKLQGYSTNEAAHRCPHPHSASNDSGQLHGTWKKHLLLDHTVLGSELAHSPSSSSGSGSGSGSDMFMDLGWSMTSSSQESLAHSTIAHSSTASTAINANGTGFQDCTSDMSPGESNISIDPSDHISILGGWRKSKHNIARLRSMSSEQGLDSVLNSSATARGNVGVQVENILRDVQQSSSSVANLSTVHQQQDAYMEHALPRTPPTSESLMEQSLVQVMAGENRTLHLSQQNAYATDGVNTEVSQSPSGNFSSRTHVLATSPSQPQVVPLTDTQTQSAAPALAAQASANADVLDSQVQSALCSAGLSNINQEKMCSQDSAVMDPQSLHCLTRQDDPQDLAQTAEPSSPASLVVDMCTQTSIVSKDISTSSLGHLICCTIILLAATVAFIATIDSRDRLRLVLFGRFDSSFDSDSWFAALVRLSLCAATFIAFVPEVAFGKPNGAATQLYSSSLLGFVAIGLAMRKASDSNLGGSLFSSIQRTSTKPTLARSKGWNSNIGSSRGSRCDRLAVEI